MILMPSAILWGGYSPGTNRPNGLIGNHDLGQLGGFNPGQPVVDLAQDVRNLFAAFPNRQRFAHAEDRRHVVFQDDLDLGVNEFVAFVVVLAAFAVPGKDITAAKFARG
jgi:hypothetical protein